MIEILSNLKVAKKHVHVYCFQGKHFTCFDLCSLLETDNFSQKDTGRPQKKATRLLKNNKKTGSLISLVLPFLNC